MKILLVGSGGREHAILRRLKENPAVETVFALPGNGGMAKEAVCVPIGARDIEGIAAFALRERVDFAVVTPDDPLVAGCVDRLEEAGIPCFGPRRNAAMIEGSKVFAKNLMKKYGIPTAAYEVFDNERDALAYLSKAPLPIVVKADGLALGKGVTVAQTRSEAEAAVRAAMRDKKFGASGEKLVIEEYLEGPEVSVLAFTDGTAVKPMASSMDHKRAQDGDVGPNTGGMGTIAPNPYYTEEVAAQCIKEIFLPTVAAMNAEGRPFRGCLYFGLMLTAQGPKVIEYNCRFGDPETQVVLPLLQSDLLTVMQALAAGKLAQTEVRLRPGYACCVVMASEGYPAAFEKGFPITIPEDVYRAVYVAGAAEADGQLVTNGGRVLGVCGTGDTLRAAVRQAYDRVARISFANAFYRKDIGQKALECREA